MRQLFGLTPISLQIIITCVTMKPAIEVRELTKVYPNGFKANDSLALSALEGQIVGLVGPNGAGKTTLIRQLLGLLRPTEGKVRVLGRDPMKEANTLRGMVGYVPQMPLYYPALTVGETLGFVLRFKGVRGRELDRRRREALAQVGLDQLVNQSGYQLSHGSMRLLLLAMAICQDPRVLILDEPTSMIDIVSRARIHRLLAKGRSNKCILLASHDMNEVRTLCDRIYVIASGRFIAEGTPQEISALVKLPVEIAFVPAVPSGVEELLRAKNISFEKEGPVFHVAFNDLPQGIEFIDDAERSLGLSYLHLEAPSLERAVLQLLQEAKHE